MELHEPSAVAGELVRYDPENPDTYPSVCNFEEEVANRFGFTGGEVLLFDQQGSYIGQVIMQLPSTKED